MQLHQSCSIISSSNWDNKKSNIYRLKRSWVFPNNTLSLICQWRSITITRKAKKIWNFCLHSLSWGHLEGTESKTLWGLYLSSFWDFLLYVLASWARSQCVFLVFLFNLSFVIRGRLSFLRDLPLIFLTFFN